MKFASSPSVKPHAKKQKSISGKFKTDLDALRSKSYSSITVSNEHPELVANQIVAGIVRQGLKPKPAKDSISLRIDHDVLEWFKAQGDGYQTRMNAVLRAYKQLSSS